MYKFRHAEKKYLEYSEKYKYWEDETESVTTAAFVDGIGNKLRKW